MDTGDKLAVGAIAALAALGIAKNRKGSRSKNDPKYAIYYRLKDFYGYTDAQIRAAGHAAPPRKSRKPARKPAKTAAPQQQSTMVRDLLASVKGVGAKERQYYANRLKSLTPQQLEQLHRTCFAG